MYPDDENTRRMKEAFAIAYLRTPTDAYGAARRVEAHPGKASWIVLHWSQDPEVLAFMQEAQEKLGAQALIPTQEEFAAQLYQEAIKVSDAETKLKYYKLFADVKGYITKEGTGGNVNVTVNKVMAYPMTTSVDEWERIAVSQQDRLLQQAQTIDHAPVSA